MQNTVLFKVWAGLSIAAGVLSALAGVQRSFAHAAVLGEPLDLVTPVVAWGPIGGAMVAAVLALPMLLLGLALRFVRRA